MCRSLLPLILVSIGIHIFVLAISTPLLEWQIKEVDSDFPPAYEVHTSTFGTLLGNFPRDSSYYGQIYVTKGGTICPYESMILIERQPHENGAIEQVMRRIKGTYVPWLENLGAIAICIAVIYMWWFAVWYRRPVLETLFLTGTGMFIFLLLSQIVRPFLWRVGPTFGFYGIVDCYHGTILFAVSLIKIHYEMPIVLLVSILPIWKAFSMMIRQIIKTVREVNAVTN